MGKQPGPLPGTDDIAVFVMPSSSARCAQLPRAADKLPFYIALRKMRDQILGRTGPVPDAELVFTDYTEMRVSQPDPKSVLKAERRRQRKAAEAEAAAAAAGGAVAGAEAAAGGAGIYEAFVGNKNFYMGKQPGPLPGTDDIAVFVMPSSSARCAQLPRAADKLPFYIALRKMRDQILGRTGPVPNAELVFTDYTEMRVSQPDPKSVLKAERRRKRKAEAAAAAAAGAGANGTDATTGAVTVGEVAAANIDEIGVAGSSGGGGKSKGKGKSKAALAGQSGPASSNSGKRIKSGRGAKSAQQQQQQQQQQPVLLQVATMKQQEQQQQQ
uniref:DUF3591 domain-containing protein n=1 Tax=Macrostomum lignano TaxID=282301 RepID=A0A1I8ICG2_9PLAT